jgi:universal stress protein F
MQRILVCLDSSPRASLVLAAAAELAVQTGARLRLLRVVDPTANISLEVMIHAASEVVGTMESEGRRELEAHALTHPLAEIEGIHIHAGSPCDIICREAKALDCDVVMLGSHGYGGLDRILGTTAAHVVDRCDRSVFVVRPPVSDAAVDIVPAVRRSGFSPSSAAKANRR